MQCPFCGKEYSNQEELLSCVLKHAGESQEEQTIQLQRLYLMLMASQLTTASLATHSPAGEVVEKFGEIYQLLESLTREPDVVGEIEKWLKDRGSGEGQ